MPARLEPFIRRVPVFRELPPPLLEPVMRAFEMRQYRDNEYLFHQGDTTRGLFIITEGEAVLMQTGPDGLLRTTGMVRAGQFINMQALFSESLETASLKAVTPVQALFLSRRDMAVLLTSYRELGPLMGLKADSQQLREVHFKTQRPNEQVLLKTHRHPWAFLRLMILPALLMMGTWFLAAQLPGIGLPLVCLSIIIPGSIMVYLYLEWANDAVIITDQRIIRIQYNILKMSESVNEVLIHSVQEARAEQPRIDLFAQLFNYGFIDIRTAGDAGNFRLDMMPNPEAIQKLIMYDHDLRKEALQAREREQMRADMAAWISGTAPAPRVNTGQTALKPAGSALLQTRFVAPDGGLVFRKHWLVWLRDVFAPGLILLLAAFLFLLNVFNPTLQSFGVVAWGLWFVIFLAGALWFIYADWDWRHDYFILKDTTIMIIHQRPLWIQNEKDQVLLRQVDNVIAESRGLLARLFRYGTVRLSLVGADTHKVFDYVPTPLEVQGEITRRQARLKQRETEERDRQERERLGEYFALYHEMQTGHQGIPMITPAAPAPPPVTPRTPPAQRPHPAAPTVPPAPDAASIASASITDRNRPPRVPLQKRPERPGPSISPGRPYAPSVPSGLPGLPEMPPPRGETDFRRADTGRPPKFPPRRPNAD